MDQETRIAQAVAKVKATEKRFRATQIDQSADAHRRQAVHPAYADQEEVCIGKAAERAAYADKLRAEADLIEADAEVKHA